MKIDFSEVIKAMKKVNETAREVFDKINSIIDLFCDVEEQLRKVMFNKSKAVQPTKTIGSERTAIFRRNHLHHIRNNC